MENRHSDIIQVAHDYMSDPETVWMIGDLAAFVRNADSEAEIVLDHAGGTITTDTGSVRIALAGMVRLVPAECASGATWVQAALLCLRDADAQMPQRTALTELGSDMMAARPEDRVGILFDLGLGVAEADSCVRTTDPALCDFLRAKAGSNIADDQKLLDTIAAAKADHVAISRLGRIEAFGGPPQNDQSTVNLPAPAGYAACMAFVPPQQAEDAAFDDATYGAFRVLHGIFADLADVRLKEAVFAGVRNGNEPDSILANGERERMVVRVGLRQLERLDGPSETLARWLRAFND